MAAPTDRALALVAQRQVRRRAFNERLFRLAAPAETNLYRCECGLIGCGSTLRLSDEEYAQVRTTPRRFVMLAEHVIPEAERVTAEHKGHVIAEKPDDIVTSCCALPVS
jgi:hypothetical protein